MDLTPEGLRGLEFRRKGRGYDADDVDEFRQKVEIWVGEMNARLREATSKLDEAETRAREAEERSRTTVEGDETIQRTLLLAQRTADAAVKEAEETAGRKVAEAEAEAERLVTDARTHRERAIAEAESEVREAIDRKRADLLDELTALERVRDTLTGDVATLEAHVEVERTRVAEARDSLALLLEDPGSLAPVEAPILSGVEVPEATPDIDVVLQPAREPEPPAVFEEDEVWPEPLASPEAAEASPWVPADSSEADDTAPPEAFERPESLFGDSRAEGSDDWSTASEDAWADTPPPPPPPPAGLEVDEAAWADAPPPPPPPPPDFDAPTEAAGSGSFGGLSGPAVPELDDVAEEDNPWLAQLADQEAGVEDGDRSRFGRRR